MLTILLLSLSCESAAPPPRRADETTFEQQVRPFLSRHCVQCHGAKNPKGDFRVDLLPHDLESRDARERWQAVLNRVESGEMPPTSRPQPARKDLDALAAWIGHGMAAASARRSAQGRVPLRRLNRVEYENTVRDLLGVQVDLKQLLPIDGSANGFDNGAEALHVSSFLMERYLEAADAALNVAITNGPQPKLIKKRYFCKDERHVKVTTERVFRHLDDALICFSSSPWQAITLSQFYPPDRGRYRFRVSASAFQSGGAPVTYRLDAGLMLMAGKTHLVGYFDAPADKPAVVEFTEHLNPRNTIRILPYGLASAQAVNKIGAEDYTGPGLAIQWIEVEGPLHDTWPPASHRRLLGDLPQVPAPVFNQRDRVEVVSKQPEVDAARLLRAFARRAFRRTLTDEEVQPYLDIFKEKLAEKYTFEAALRAAFKGVMVSPDFLFLHETPGRLDDFALASRMSYFLWSTTPDDELLALAEKRQLRGPATLRRQVERLLSHPKAAAFTENFVDQWLGLRDLDFTVPDRRLYPEFDDLLKAAMLSETRLFFNEVLANDLSLTSFVASDFTLLNERLAKHYGIGGVKGHTMRKVTLPPGSHRGGVMTMGSVLKVTANGTTTSPVVRGAWVLDRILGTPPAPPPAGVPAVEPDIRGATTIREQLAKHREVPSCATCHRKIDPPGFALENFDVIGGWRDNYRTLGRGKPVLIEGRRMPYLQGPQVTPADALDDGRKFRDIDELKKLLLADKDQLARALAVKLLTYGTGGAPDPADRPQVEAIVGKVREKGYGFRTLIHEVVRSSLFQSK